MQNLVAGLRRLAIERVHCRPSTTPISLGDEADAFGILEHQWHAKTFRCTGRFGGQSLRELLEITCARVRRAVVHTANHVSKAGDGRVALGNTLEREPAIVVVLHLIETLFEIEVLILERVRQFMRE